MEARLLTPRELPLPRLGLVAALASCVLFALVASFFVVRRISGGFSANLPTGGYLLVAMLIVLISALPRLAGARLLSGRGDLTLRLTFLLLPGIALLAIVAALSTSSLAVWPLVLAWLCVAAEEGAWWTLFLRRSIPREALRAESPAPMQSISQLEATSQHSGDEELLPENLVQQLTRVRTENGGEAISGVLRADFAAGERNQNLHVAFCPPLASVPEFMFEQVDGPSATIKASQVETFGARLEVRLDAPAKEATPVVIELSTS